MHETALMKHLLDVVERAAMDDGGAPVRLIHLSVGDMAGVSVEALRFAFEVMARGTAAAGASLEVERIPLRLRCRTCGAQWRPGDFVFVCSGCGSPELDVLAGREMQVDYILVGDDETGPAETGA